MEIGSCSSGGGICGNRPAVSRRPREAGDNDTQIAEPAAPMSSGRRRVYQLKRKLTLPLPFFLLFWSSVDWRMPAHRVWVDLYSVSWVKCSSLLEMPSQTCPAIQTSLRPATGHINIPRRHFIVLFE